MAAPELRKRAEALAAHSPGNAKKGTAHELQVHRIELEMQNEHLRETEQELTQLLDRYFELYDLAPVGYLNLTERGLVATANLTACELLGIPRAQLLKHPFISLVVTEHQRVYAGAMNALRKTGRPQHCELMLCKKGGSPFFAKLEANRVRDPDGGAPTTRLILSDISRSKKLEAESEVRERRLRIVIENAGVGIYEADPNGRVVMVNEHLCRILGRPRERLLGGADREFIHMSDLGRADHLHNDLLSGRRERFQEEIRYVRPDGGVVWTRVTATAWREAPTEPPRRIVIVEDVSAGKENERQLEAYRTSLEDLVRQRTARLRQLSGVFSNASDAIIVEDLEGKIIEVNPEAERVYGYPKEELIGRSVSMLFLPGRRRRAERLRQRCRRGQELRNVEGVRKDKSGRKVTVLLSGFPLRDEKDRVVAVATIAKDISLRKQMEAALLESRANLKALSRKAIDALEADRRAVSRELHDSIGGSLAAIKFMLEETADSTQAAGLNSAIGFLQQTIKEVKRISSYLRPLALDDLGLTATISECVRQFEAQYGIGCTLQIALEDGEVPESLHIVLFRVLQEALANVGRHSRAVNAEIGLKREQSRIVLTVADDGCGFDPKAAVPADPLSGYGIRSMRERIEICRGDLKIESRPGRGTRLRARVPI